MLKVGVLFCSLLFAPIIALAQHQTLVPIKSKGLIPNDFLLPPEIRLMNSVENLKREDSRKLREIQKDFYIQQSYYLKSLLSSGNVLFGDTVSNYIHQVAQKILVHSPELKDKLRFYTIRSSAVNAFTTQEGIILINLGLMAKIKNEAQLAFILCHEISHYTQQHLLKIFQETRQSHHRQGGIFEKITMEERLFTQNTYTQNTEYQADSLGLQLYLKTGYSTDEINDLFDRLENGEQLYDNSIFNFSALNINNHSFFKAEIPELQGIVEDTSETPSSHPQAAQRKERLKKSLPKKTKSKTTFYLPESIFQYVQKVARMETCTIELENRHYETTLYNITVLEQLYPEESLFWQQHKTYTLYALCKYINSARLWEIQQDYQIAPKQIQLLAYYLENIDAKYLTFLTLHHLQKAQKENSTQKIWQKLGNSLGEDVARYYPDSLVSFHEIFPFEINSIPNLAKKPSHLSPEKQQKRLILKGINLGIDSIMFVSPTYQRFDYRKANPEDYFGGQAMELGLIRKITEYANSLNLWNEVLHNSSLTPTDTATYNDLMLLHYWIKEKLSHPEGFPIVSLHYDEIQTLVGKYKTPYFAWTGGVNVIQTRQQLKKKRFLRFLSLPYYQFNPKYETFFYTLVYDMRAEKYLVKYPRRTHLNDQADMFHSVIYDIIYQLKHSPTKPKIKRLKR